MPVTVLDVGYASEQGKLCPCSQGTHSSVDKRAEEQAVAPCCGKCLDEGSIKCYKSKDGGWEWAGDSV